MPQPQALARLLSPWRAKVGPASRSVRAGLLLMAVVAGAPLARLGTPPARAGAALAVLAALLIGVSLWWRHRTTLHSPRLALKRVVVPAAPDVGQRALRAHALAAQAEAGTLVGSSELAREHFARIMAGIDPDAITASVRRRTRVLNGIGAGATAVALGVALVSPAVVLEGLNVLLARDGRAPFTMPWLGSLDVEVRPPPYLRLGARPLFYAAEAEVPAGSILVLRGTPLRPNRQLVLTDGHRSVALAPNGEGEVSGEWELAADASLRIAARFGDVLVFGSDALELTAIPDEPPVVSLEGAPRTLRMSEIERLELGYSVRDDYGIRQIELVLRSGSAEERRVLGRFDGETRFETGSYALDREDRFLREAFMPVDVHIEARDTNDRDGVQWARSAGVRLQPNAVGESEAKRYQALTAGVGALVDVLAKSEGLGVLPANAEPELAAAQAGLLEVASGNFAGLEFGPGMSAFIQGQAQLLKRDGAGSVARLNRLKDVILALDVAAQQLAARDAQHTAIRLARIAEELALAAREFRRLERAGDPQSRLEAARFALGEGIRQLQKMGDLGSDLGGVARADFGRLGRAVGRQDMTHAQLIAEHMAARLARPTPSFGSAGGGGAVEAGKSSVQPLSGTPSNAHERFDRLAEELAELAKDHGGQLGDVEGALEQAEASLDQHEHSQELQKRAQELRDVLEPLPRLGPDTNSAPGQAALGREHGEAMADAMQQQALDQALDQARAAIESLQQAKRRLAREWMSPEALEQVIDRAQDTIRNQQEYLRALQQRLAEARANRARSALRQLAERESELARRATNLGARGRHSGASLPEEKLRQLGEAARLMHRASDALHRAEGERALQLQRAAQQLLEQSDMGKLAREPGQRESGRDGSPKVDTKGEVPEEAPDEGARAFRRRVLEGLRRGQSERLAPAVERYAEGLLQ